MPLKWRLFRLANYCQLIALLAVIMRILYTNIQYRETAAPFWIFSIGLLASLLLLANNFMNFRWLDKYYPDKDPGRRFKMISMILFLAAILITAALAVWLVFFLFQTFHTGSFRGIWQHPLYFTLLSLLALISVSGLYLLCIQMDLPGIIRRNQQAHFDQFPV